MIIKVEYKLETVIVMPHIGDNSFEIHVILIQIRSIIFFWATVRLFQANLSENWSCTSNTSRNDRGIQSSVRHLR